MTSAAASAAKIMVVEDNEMLLVLLQRVLERAGYDVIPACNGDETMKLVAASPPDLIVLDIGLPDVDGCDLLAALKNDARTSHIPVMIWSGGWHRSERRIVLALGAEDYVEKGPPSRLVTKIESVLLRISEREAASARASSIPSRR